MRDVREKPSLRREELLHSSRHGVEVACEGQELFVGGSKLGCHANVEVAFRDALRGLAEAPDRPRQVAGDQEGHEAGHREDDQQLLGQRLETESVGPGGDSTHPPDHHRAAFFQAEAHQSSGAFLAVAFAAATHELRQLARSMRWRPRGDDAVLEKEEQGDVRLRFEAVKSFGRVDPLSQIVHHFHRFVSDCVAQQVLAALDADRFVGGLFDEDEGGRHASHRDP